MSIKWMIGIVFCFVAFSLLCGIGEMTTFGEGEVTRLQVLVTAPNFTEVENVFEGITVLAAFTWDWVANFISMLLWDYSFFQGQWAMVKYLIYFPVSIGIIWGLVSALRGVRS